MNWRIYGSFMNFLRRTEDYFEKKKFCRNVKYQFGKTFFLCIRTDGNVCGELQNLYIRINKPPPERQILFHAL